LTSLLETSKTIYKNKTMRNLPWKKILMRTLWIMLGVATMVLFVMAWQEKDKKTIKDIQIQIAGDETQLFINERDIKEMLKAGGHIIGAKNRPILSKPDSQLLKEVLALGKFLNKDSLWGAQIAQIDITPQANFELVPVIGDHIISLGKATDLEAKFSRLQTFYKQAWMQKGVRFYERIDIRYKDQVVAIKQGTAKAQIDSAQSALLIQGLMAQSALDAAAAADSLAVKVATKVVDTVKQKAVLKPVINIDNKTKIAPLNKKAKQNSKTKKKTNN